jgi:hypothetical protein
MFFPILTVTQPASSYDLVTLAVAKDELSLSTNDTSNDVWLAGAITQSSKAIAKFCNGRIFVPEGVSEYFDVRRDCFGTPIRTFSPSLQLSRRPLISVTSVTQYPVGNPSVTLVADTDFRVDAERGSLNRLNSNTGLLKGWEEQPLLVNYLAGFGDLSTETYVIAGTPPQATVAQALNYNWTQSVFYTGGAALAQVNSNPAAGQYSVGAGVFTFNTSDVGKSVTISYAFNQIPDDLVDACLRLVTQRFHGRGRDPMQMERTTPGMGTERFWIPAKQQGSLPPEIAGMLDGTYRVPVAV